MDEFHDKLEVRGSMFTIKDFDQPRTGVSVGSLNCATDASFVAEMRPEQFYVRVQSFEPELGLDRVPADHPGRYVLRADSSADLAFWFEVRVPSDQLDRVRCGGSRERIAKHFTKGRIWDVVFARTDGPTTTVVRMENLFGELNEVYVESWDDVRERWMLSVRHSKCSQPWFEVFLPTEVLEHVAADALVPVQMEKQHRVFGMCKTSASPGEDITLRLRD